MNHPIKVNATVTTDIVHSFADEMDDTAFATKLHCCDNYDDDVVDKENEPPVTPLESTNNSLVTFLEKKEEAAAAAQENHKSFVTTTGEEKLNSSNNQKTPPTGELPEFKSRRRDEKFRFHDHVPRSLHARPIGRFMQTRRGRKMKHPGLRQVLSPKALYPSAPPIYKVLDFFY